MTSNMKWQDNKAWFLLIPAGTVMLIVGVLPLIAVFNYSFLDIFTLKNVFWVGTDWYSEIVSSQRFLHSLLRSLLFSVIVISVQVPLGIGIAMLLTRSGPWRVVVLMLLALPMVVPWNMIPLLWLNLIDVKHGFVGQVLGWMGFTFDYQFNALHTWVLLVVMDTWHWLGLVVILAYAGLSGISSEYYRAASIDGASRLAVFRYIQLPKISGVLSVAVLLRFVDSFMIYTEAFHINAGGPQKATHFLAIDLGEDIKAFSYGSAAARAMIYFLLVVTLAWMFKMVIDRQNPNASGEAP
jgi:glycerol transport system permease protein